MSRVLIIVALCMGLLVGALTVPMVRNSVTASQAQNSSLSQPLDAPGVQSGGYMDMFLQWLGQYVMKMFGGFVESQVTAIEKTISGRKELTQAKLNSKAAGESSERFAEAQDKFNSAPERTCRLLNESKETAIAVALTDVNTKALGRTDVKRLSSTDSSSQVATKILDDHNKLYCSDTDVERGRCETPTNMKNADISAETLFMPKGTNTYSPEQVKAAQDFIRMATRPVPIEDLPKALESSAGGQRYLLEQKRSVALDSLVSSSFNRILASRAQRN